MADKIKKLLEEFYNKKTPDFSKGFNEGIEQAYHVLKDADGDKVVEVLIELLDNSIGVVKKAYDDQIEVMAREYGFWMGLIYYGFEFILSNRDLSGLFGSLAERLNERKIVDKKEFYNALSRVNAKNFSGPILENYWYLKNRMYILK